MSSSFAATKSTSAAINVQARYAPSTETIRPALTNAVPHEPTAASSTPAIDGWRSSAISARGRMP